MSSHWWVLTPAGWAGPFASFADADEARMGQQWPIKWFENPPEVVR